MMLPAASAAVAGVAALHAVWRLVWGYPDRAAPRVLAYHKIARFELGGTWVAPRRFERQIDALLEAGIRFIDEETFIDTVEGGRAADPSEVLLTFDDGYDCFRRHAASLLERRGVPALVFLVTGCAGRENDWELPLPGRRARHLGWDEVAELGARGFSFGSHTVTHRALTRLAPAEVRDELALSRLEIERRTGRAVRSLAYPFGMVDGAVAREAQRAGYRAAFALCPPGRAARNDRFLIRREGVWVIDTPRTIRVKLSRRGLFWVEDLKARAISACSVLTPLLGRRGA